MHKLETAFKWVEDREGLVALSNCWPKHTAPNDNQNSHGYNNGKNLQPSELPMLTICKKI